MPNRRAEDRTTTVFRPALIETEAYSGFCLVRNLSSTGMMARVYGQLPEGERIGVQFCPEVTAYGSLIWCTANDVGVTFDDVIDVQSVLANFAKAKHEDQLARAPRLPIKVDGHVLIGDRPFTVSLKDISQKGVKVTGFLLKPEEEVLLCLDGLEPKKCVVRWAQLGANGLRFVQPLRFDQLGHWVISQQLKQLGQEAGGSRNRLEGQCIS